MMKNIIQMLKPIISATKVVMNTKLFISILIIAFSNTIGLAQTLPTPQVLMQKFFPFKNISFAYKKIYYDDDVNKEENSFVMLDIPSLTYKSIPNKNKSSIDYNVYSYSFREEKFEQLMDNRYFIISKNRENGIAYFPEVLTAWMSPMLSDLLLFPSKNFSDIKISTTEKYFIMKYYSGCIIYFNKENLNFEKLERYTDLENGTKHIDTIINLSDFTKVGVTMFPCSIKIQIYNDNKVSAVWDITIDKSTIKTNDSFNENTSISIPENTQVWDRITDKRYIYVSKKATSK